MSSLMQGMNRSSAVNGSLNGAKDTHVRQDDQGKDTA